MTYKFSALYTGMFTSLTNYYEAFDSKMKSFCVSLIWQLLTAIEP